MNHLSRNTSDLSSCPTNPLVGSPVSSMHALPTLEINTSDMYDPSRIPFHRSYSLRSSPTSTTQTDMSNSSLTEQIMDTLYLQSLSPLAASAQTLCSGDCLPNACLQNTCPMSVFSQLRTRIILEPYLSD